MTFLHRQLARLLVGTMVAFVSAGAIARAQDDEEKDEMVEVSQNDQQQRAIDMGRAEAKKEYKDQLERWMASPSGTRVDVHAQLEAQLKDALGKLKEDCHPTESQMKKLELAGRGDIKRFMDRLDQAGRDFDDAPDGFDQLEMIQLEVRRAMNAMSAGLFGEDSLFFKTLVKNDLRYPISVARALDALRGNLRLKQNQSTELQELLRRETRPPTKYGKASELALILYQASRVPAERFRRILSEAQWREMARWITTYTHGSGSEVVLKRNGFVFDDETIVTHHKPAVPVAKDVGHRDSEGINRD